MAEIGLKSLLLVAPPVRIIFRRHAARAVARSADENEDEGEKERRSDNPDHVMTLAPMQIRTAASKISAPIRIRL